MKICRNGNFAAANKCIPISISSLYAVFSFNCKSERLERGRRELVGMIKRETETATIRPSLVNFFFNNNSYFYSTSWVFCSDCQFRFPATVCFLLVTLTRKKKEKRQHLMIVFQCPHHSNGLHTPLLFNSIWVCLVK